MRKNFAVIVLLLLALTLPVWAKDKEFQDATLQFVDNQFNPAYGSNDDVICSQAHVGNKMRTYEIGDRAVKGYLFSVKLGDFVYEGCVEKKLWSKIHKEEWADNTPVKVRFNVKGGFAATRTEMFIQKADGKEINAFLVHILDGKKNNYCGVRKCDPESAAKQLKKREAGGE